MSDNENKDRICYKNGDPLPPRGWLVICMVIGKYVIVTDLDRLAYVIGSTQDEADRKFPTALNPVQVFELGREMTVGLKFQISSMGPVK